MYSQAIENELNLQTLNEENEKLKKILEDLEREEEQNTIKSNILDTNNTDKGEYFSTEQNSFCDINIFKKLQDKLNQESRRLDQTINKYQFKEIPIEQSKENSFCDNPFNKPLIINESFTSKKNGINIINNSHEYESLIFKIPSILLDNKIEEISVYIKLEMCFEKIQSIDTKLNYISLLKQVLNNVVMLKHASFPVFLNLYNYILSLQSNELNRNDFEPSLANIQLQNLLDYILTNKELSEMLRTIIVLIKRYFPPNLSIILVIKTITILKLLTEYLKKIKAIIYGSNIHLKEVLSEINDFLYEYPPGKLNKKLPLFELYYEIFEEMKKITDCLVKNKKNSLKEMTEAISFVKSRNITVSIDFIKYLEYAVYKCES